MNNIMVTGGSGFIGSELTQQLVNKGYAVFDFDIIKNPEHDILDEGAVINFIQDNNITYVLHLAAIANLNWAAESFQNTEECLNINIQGTQNVAMACARTDVPMIYISTVCVYGNQTEHPTTEEHLPNPAEIYAHSKLAGEHAIKGISLSWGLRYNIARIATVYGNGQRPALGTWIFMDQAFRDVDITVHGEGTQERTLTHVSDISSGLIAIMEKGKINETYNVTTDKPVSALHMAEYIKHYCKSTSTIVHIEQRKNQVFREEISYAKLHNDTGWEPQYTFKEGIEETISHYKKEDFNG